jgi:DNA-binding winged helix-turn-helix (wHTH) protein
MATSRVTNHRGPAIAPSMDEAALVALGRKEDEPNKIDSVSAPSRKRAVSSSRRPAPSVDKSVPKPAGGCPASLLLRRAIAGGISERVSEACSGIRDVGILRQGLGHAIAMGRADIYDIVDRRIQELALPVPAGNDAIGETGTITYGDLSLCRTTSCLKRGDLEIKLSKTQYRILRMLMERPDRIFQYGDLMKASNLSQYRAGRNALSHVINEIRKKLHRLGVRDLIRTEASTGYGLRAEEDIP